MSKLRKCAAVGAIMIGGVVGSLGLSGASVSAATAAPATHATTMSPSDWCRWHDCGGRGCWHDGCGGWHHRCGWRDRWC